MSADLPFVVAIPARLGSTRLPRKPLREIAGTPLVVHVAQRARAAGAREVVVATDAEEIVRVLEPLGVRVCMTRATHASGTDRLAEVAEQLAWPEDTIVVNLQGDEPLAPASGIRAVAETLAASAAPMATLATPIHESAQLVDPNCVKVVRSRAGLALYFGRAPLPWARDAFALAPPGLGPLPAGVPFLRHIGIYAYRAGFLRALARLPQSELERAESLEQLRALEFGHAIAVGLAPEPFPAGVDTEADVARVEALMRSRDTF
jgi:3-deoxy-manno-octulosonate cytidylyltransferase (CMP-KDO synthetase)